MKHKFIPEIGQTIAFPDDMTDAQISADIRDYIIPQATGKAPETTFMGQAKEFGKGFVDAIPRGGLSALRGIAALVDVPEGKAVSDVQKARRSYEESSIGQALAANPGYEDSYARMGGSALGSVVPLLAASVFGGTIPATALAVAQGAGGQGENIDEQRRQGKSISSDQERLAMLFGGGIGATEMLPLGRLTGPMRKAAMGAAAKATGRTAAEVSKRGTMGALASLGVQALEEGGQEAGSQFLNNLVEQQLYNDKRGLGEGVIQSGLLGGLVGGGLDVSLGRMARRMEARQLEAQQEPTKYMQYDAPAAPVSDRYVDALSQLFAAQPQTRPAPATKTVQSWDGPFTADPALEDFYGVQKRADGVQERADEGPKKNLPEVVQPQPPSERRRKQAIEVPETGMDESVARAVAEREDLAKGFGKRWEDLSNSERIAIDELRAEGNTGSPTAAYSRRLQQARPVPPPQAIAGASALSAPATLRTRPETSVRGVAPVAPQGVAPIAVESGSSNLGARSAIGTEGQEGRPGMPLAAPSGGAVALLPPTAQSSPEQLLSQSESGLSLGSSVELGLTPQRLGQDGKTIYRDQSQPQSTAEWQAQAKPAVARMRAFADNVGAKDVHLRFIDRIEDRISGKPVDDAKGAWERGLVQVSFTGTESPEALIGTTSHELTHAFKAIGLFNPQETSALEKQVTRDGTLAEIQGDQFYGKLTAEQQKEEAIAHAFERYMVGEYTGQGQTSGLFNRAKNFLGRMHSGLKGQGFLTAQDVMDRFNQGDIGRRNRENGVEIQSGVRINGNVASVNVQPDRPEQAVSETQAQGGNGSEDLPQALISGIGDQSGIEGTTMYSRRQPADQILSMVSPANGTGKAKSIPEMRAESGLSREAFDKAFVDLVKSDRIQSSRGDMKVERMLQDGLIREDEYVRDPATGRPYLTASREDASIVSGSLGEQPARMGQVSEPKVLPESQAKDTPLYSRPLRSANPQVQADYDNWFGKAKRASLMEKVKAVFASKDSARDAITLARQEVFDGRARIADLTRKAAKSDRDLMADRSAEGSVRFADRSPNVFAGALTHGHLVYKNGYVSAKGGKGLLSIIRPLVNKNLTEEAFLYIAAKRGGKLLEDGKERLMTKQEIDRALQLVNQHPEIETFEKEYNAWNKAIVQLLVDSGRIDQATGDKWTSGTYLPFYRLTEQDLVTGPRATRSIAGGKKIEALKGGSKKINDPLENIIQNGLALTDIAMKNISAQRIIRDGLDVGWVRHAKLGDKDTVVTAFVDGKGYKFKVEDQLLYDAMTQSDLPSGPLFDLVLGGTRAGAQLLRGLVTKSPTFFVKNILRDSIEVWFKGGHNVKPILGALDGIQQVISNSKNYDALERAGVVGGTLLEGGAEGTAKRIQRKLDIASGTSGKLKSMWDAVGEASDKSEAVNRVKIYEEAMARHGNEAQAAYESLEVMNFSRQGRSAVMRILSAMIPFFNARLQGLDWMGRAAAGHAYGMDASRGGRGAEIQRTMIRRGLFMAGATMAYAFLNADNDDWKNATPEERANNWFIPMGDGKPSLRVPIPFELGFIFKTVPEDIAANMMKVDTNRQTLSYVGTGILNQLMQPLVPQAIKPAFENAINYSFFKGRKIESEAQSRLLPEYRSDDYTSEIAKSIGEATGTSPLKIDNLMKGYSGTIGTIVFQVMDGLMRDGKGEAPERAIWQTPGISSFFQRPDGARQIIDFYEASVKISEVTQSLKLLQASDPAKLPEFIEKHKAELMLGDVTEETGKKMTDLRKLKRSVQNHPTMPGADKRKMLDQIRQTEIELTKPINETIRKVTNQ